MEQIIDLYNQMPSYIRIILIVLGLGIILSIFKKFLKVAILLAVLVILLIVIFKLVTQV